MPFFIIRKLRTCIYAAVVFIAMAVSSNTYAQVFEFNDKRKRETLPFRLVKNLIIVPVMINDKGPYNFVLDTGVGLMIITDTTLVDSLNIAVLRSIKLTGFGTGEDLSAYVTPSIKVNLAHTTAKSIPAGILKKDVFDLSGYVGFPVHGLLGFDFFNSFTVRINYSNSLITIFRPDFHYIYSRGSRFPLIVEDKKPYLQSEIKLPSGEVFKAKLIIDTGAGHPVSLERLNDKPIEVPPVSIRANLGIGLTGPISGFMARIQYFKIGKYRLDNVISAFPDFDEVASKVTENRNGNLGNSILRRFTVVLDYKRKHIYLKPGLYYNDPFEHDMSGMELTAVGEDFDRLMISRVEPNSAAADAELKEGDIITAINFKPIHLITPQDVDDMFRSRNERIFILDILPYGEKDVVRVFLTLRRRI